MEKCGLGEEFFRGGLDTRFGGALCGLSSERSKRALSSLYRVVGDQFVGAALSVCCSTLFSLLASSLCAAKQLQLLVWCGCCVFRVFFVLSWALVASRDIVRLVGEVSIEGVGWFDCSRVDAVSLQLAAMSVRVGAKTAEHAYLLLVRVVVTFLMIDRWYGDDDDGDDGTTAQEEEADRVLFRGGGRDWYDSAIGTGCWFYDLDLDQGGR